MQNLVRTREANTRVVTIKGTASQKVAPRNNNRRFLLIQNKSTVDTVKISDAKGNFGGIEIPPTGAFLLDIGISLELWASNETQLSPLVELQVMEVFGLDAFEDAMLRQLEKQTALLESLLNRVRV